MSSREQEGLEAVPTIKGAPVDHSHSGLEATTSPTVWNQAPAPQYQDRPDLHNTAWQPEANVSPPAPYNNVSQTHQAQEPVYNPYPPIEAEKAPKKRICGLRKTTFFLLLLAILLALAVVGAGVGGAVAAKNSNKSVNNAAAAVGYNGTTTLLMTTTSAAATKTITTSVGTASTTSTSLVTATAGSTVTPATDCISYGGSLNKKTQTTNINGTAVQIICSNDWPGNDMVELLVPDFVTCIGIGLQWNANKTNANNQTAGVAYTGFGSFSESVNCYLKAYFSGSGDGAPTKAVAIFNTAQFQPTS